MSTALDVIAEHGIVGTSHRTVAAAADVPLGSLTYHFSSLDDLLAAAFSRHVETVSSRFQERIRAAPDREAALESLADYLATDLSGPPKDLALIVELHLGAIRGPILRTVAQDWVSRSRRSLEQRFDPVAARELAMLIMGLALQSSISTEPMDRDQIEHAVDHYKS